MPDYTFPPRNSRHLVSSTSDRRRVDRISTGYSRNKMIPSCEAFLCIKYLDATRELIAIVRSLMKDESRLLEDTTVTR